MKRVLLFFLVFLMVGVFAFSADLMNYPRSLDGGNILVDVGFGYALAPKPNTTINIPPILLSAEYCLPSSVPISVGGLVGFYQYGYKYKEPGSHVPWEETLTFVTFGARANWHWNVDININWIDLYTGIIVGYNYFSQTIEGNPYSGYVQSAHGGLAYGGQAGAHFYFSDRIGAVVELGYPFVAKAGVALKF